MLQDTSYKINADRTYCDGLAVWRRCRRHHARHLTGVPVHSAPLAGCSPRRGRRASARRLSPGMCVRRPPGRTLPPGMRVRPLRLPLSPAARGAPRLSLPSVQSCVWPSLPPCVVDPPRRVVALRSCRVHWVIAVRGPRGRSGRGDSTSGDVERHNTTQQGGACQRRIEGPRPSKAVGQHIPTAKPSQKRMGLTVRRHSASKCRG